MKTSTIYLLVAFVCLGVLIKVLQRFTHKKDTTPINDAPSQTNTQRPEGCCGQHAVCEKESLIAASSKMVYFEDEELDVFKGRLADSYTDEETEQFWEVLLTLKPTEVAEWLKSISLRGIDLPEAVREQALNVVSELRAQNN